MKLVALRGPLVMAVLCGIPLVLWLRSAPVGPRFSSSTLALTSTAVLFAFAGTAAFAINLVLGARIRFVERLFGGLDRMYRVHRQNGQIAFALLAMHAFLIFAGRVTVSVSSGFDLVTPRAGRTIFAGFVAITLMGIAIVLTLFVRLGQEVFVYVQRSFGFVFLLATYHVFTTHGAKDRSPALKWFMAALATAGIAAFVYRSLLHNVLVRRKRYTVTAVNRLDEFVTEIVMEPRAKPLGYKAGQFVFVSFRSTALRTHQRALDISLQRQVFSIRAGEVSNQFHPFSITSAPGEPTLRITVKAIGDYTRALRRLLDEGAEAVVEGPFGSFSNAGLRQPQQIWIAGGIGVTPFLSMARAFDGRDDGAPVHFYYCVERPEEAHFLDEMRAIAGRHAGFRITVVARDRDGFLTADRLAAENAGLASADVLICGPPTMIVNLRNQLVERGLPERQVHAEEFGFAKRGPEEAPPPVEPADPREPVPASSPLPAILFALAFAVFAFAGGVLVGQSRSSGGGGTTAVAVDTSPASVAAGKAVYASAGCGGCHVLAATGSNGSIGPNLDDAKPDAAAVVAVVTTGKGVMPAYRGRLTPKQIQNVAAFVLTAAGP